MRQSFLVQDIADPTLWRIITLWESREALEEMRKQGTPGGVLMFRSVGTEPELTIFGVVEQLTP